MGRVRSRPYAVREARMTSRTCDPKLQERQCVSVWVFPLHRSGAVAYRSVDHSGRCLHPLRSECRYLDKGRKQMVQF